MALVISLGKDRKRLGSFQVGSSHEEGEYNGNKSPSWNVCTVSTLKLSFSSGCRLNITIIFDYIF